MGSVSGDVNSLSMRCVDETDLVSRPVASMKSGDEAWVESFDGDAIGPRFFWNATSAIAVPSPGVFRPTSVGSGVGRWLAESIYGGNTAPSESVFAERTADTAIAEDPETTVLCTTGPVLPTTDGVVDLTAAFGLNMGADCEQIACWIETRLNGAGAWAQIGRGCGTSAIATKTGGGAIVYRHVVASGTTREYRLVAMADDGTATCNPTTRPTTDSASIRAEFKRTP